MLFAGFLEFLSNQLKRFFPCSRRQLPIFADQGLRQTIFMVSKIESVAALDTQEIPVDAALVAIVAAHNLHASLGAAHAQRGLASVRAMSACRADMIHFPRTRLITISSRRQRAHRADVDARTALFALQMIFFIRRDYGGDAAVLHSERPHIHALAANANAPITENASRP